MILSIISLLLIAGISIYLLGSRIGVKGGRIISIGGVIIGLIEIIKELENWSKEGGYKIRVRDWYEIGAYKGGIEFLIDKESITMVGVIIVITGIVIIYSYWYMGKEEEINIFISELLIFAVAMIIFVASKSYLVSFIGWEVIGLISFLLINYWSNSIQNNKSAIKAIIFNKIGDLAYIVAMGLLTIKINSTNYITINNLIIEDNQGKITIMIIILLIIAAMAKSAQILLHCWLGDAMAGPTPVSALLHAATMVTAGIYLLIRSKILIYESQELIQYLIINIGLLTIIFAGITSLNQYDIKKIIAYSTCSQIGYMFVSIGLFSPDLGALFHLITHAFAKALLFLTAGIIIHSYLGEQDIRKFGNLLYKTPSGFLFFLFGGLSLMGLSGFSGYFSKELIIIEALSYPKYILYLLILGSLLTTFYCLRILYFLFIKSAFFSLNVNSFFSSPYNLKTFGFFIPFGLLLWGCLFLGDFSFSYFILPNLINLDLEFYLHLTSSPFIWFKSFLFFLPFLGSSLLSIYYLFFNPSLFFLSNSYISSLFHFFHIIFNYKLFFDVFYNYFFVNPSFLLSYHFFFKSFDRGFIEYLFILTPFRFFSSFFSSFNSSSLPFSNSPLILTTFFLTISLFLSSLLLLYS